MNFNSSYVVGFFKKTDKDVLIYFSVGKLQGVDVIELCSSFVNFRHIHNSAQQYLNLFPLKEIMEIQ